MPKVFRLAYCEFASRNLDAEAAYYTDVLGAQLTEKAADGTQYLSLGLDHHNIAVRHGDRSGLATAGFQLAEDVSCEDIYATLSSIGLKPQHQSDARPGVSRLVEVADVAGYRFQFFSEMTMPAPGFTRTAVGPNRLGHIALLSPEAEKLVAFFRDGLGFWTTDWFEGLATFLTCSYDHHVVNIVGAPITKLHHIAYELRGCAHQYEAADLVARAGHPILWGPSRHTAGHNYASYHFDPDRTLIELYADMDIYVPGADRFEPRPWHEHMPQRPRRWPASQLNAWETQFVFDFATA